MAKFDFGDGVARELKLDLAALRHFKKFYGKPMWRVWVLGEGEDFVELNVDHGCQTHVLWASRLHSEPDATYATTEELMQKYLDGGGDVMGFGEILSELYKESGLFEKRSKPPNAEGDPPKS